MKTISAPPLTNEMKVRFLEKIEIDLPYKCWRWIGAKNLQGYGKFSLNRTTYQAHRVSYYFNTGKDPKGLCILHSCDNPICVNPLHLTAGTQIENLADMRARGRGHTPVAASGEKQHLSKLKAKDIPEIRLQYRDGSTYSVIAEKYKVTFATIAKVVTKQTWRHIE